MLSILFEPIRAGEYGCADRAGANTSGEGDTIKEFVVSGTAENVSGRMLGSCVAGARCSFSGTMMVDETTNFLFPGGHVSAWDITFPGVAAFVNCCAFQGVLGGGSQWYADSRETQSLFLLFDTTHTPGSLVGFDGGSITGLDVVDISVLPFMTLYLNLRGTITPVPEPSSLAVLGAGVLVLTQGLRRKLM